MEFASHNQQNRPDSVPFLLRSRKPATRGAFIFLTLVILFIPALLILDAAMAAVGARNHVKGARVSRAGSQAMGKQPAAIAIDYPEEGSIFPPEITPPTFLWRDGDKTAALWRIDVSFGDGSAEIRDISKGEHLRVGTIDPACIAETNEPPKLTPQQAAARTWIPGAAIWASIKKHSTRTAATVTITGYRNEITDRPVSRGRVTISTSNDPVGAPIFYRDVPLMPTETETGSIKPLAPYAVRLIRWRLRNISEPNSRVVMENVPMCANCHSFSADGKTLGMDLDGLQNNKGLYTLTPLKPETSIRNENVIQWSTSRGKLQGNIRVGFMSQVSPHGQYVVTTIDGPGTDGMQTDLSPTGNTRDSASNYYVANFKNYRFLQVFYPTRGVLAWYSRETGILQPLPGADNPRYVQMGGVWSPDGKYLVFARAEAKEPNPEGAPLAKFANDPNERQIRYDLYRIPFNEGRGGIPQRIEGASGNGMSNSFPKISPDGRWIVFVQCRNGLLMRPDSQLYIVPAAGGEARKMRCNTKLMNSWHSFSPNGRWLVFSSKSRSPYTQMYLTHIDHEGKDSPAILIENSTAANRAVNIPEFINTEQDGLRKIGGPAIEYYRLVDSATYLRKNGKYEDSIETWKRVLGVRSDDALANENLGTLLLLTGRPQEAASHLNRAKEVRLDEVIVHLRKAVDINPGQAPAHYNLGLVLSRRGKTDEAITQWQKALEINPGYAEAHASLGNGLYSRGRIEEALEHWLEAIRSRPDDVQILQQAAWVLATCPAGSIRDGCEALALAERANELSGGKNALILDTLAAAYAEVGRFADAASTALRALSLIEKTKRQPQADAIKIRLGLYREERPFRETHASPVLP